MLGNSSSRVARSVSDNDLWKHHRHQQRTCSAYASECPDTPGGTTLDTGFSRLFVDDQGVLMVESSGHHQGDIVIVDMGGGMFHGTGSGNITVTGVSLNTTPSIRVAVIPEAELKAGSSNAVANVRGPGSASAGLQFRLRPLDPLVTIIAVPVPEPTAPGFAALFVLAALVRWRRRA